jgi:alkylhydroperoxidase family enzyme
VSASADSGAKVERAVSQFPEHAQGRVPTEQIEYASMTARISSLAPPYDAQLQTWFDAVMHGKPPLLLFTTLARDPRLFAKFTAASLLDRGHLTLRQREIVIDRTTARCGAEYEWGIHVATFGAKVRLSGAQVRSLVHGGPDDPCWEDEERDLLRLCDSLHRNSDVDDALWASLRKRFSEDAMLELLMLAGFYRTISYLTNALRLPLEPGAARFSESGKTT